MLCSHLVAKHCTRVHYLLATSVKMSFFQVLKPEFEHSAHAGVQDLALVLRK